MHKGWLHGTDIKFDDWVIPTPASPSKPELVRHTAAFLTRDRTLALAGDQPFLCKADVKPRARILNLLEHSAASEAMRVKVTKGNLGRHHEYAKRQEWWIEAWRQGIMMRFGTNDPQMRAQSERIQRLGRQLVSGIITPETKAAWLGGQNLTRSWIEELAVAGRELGFDVLVGREVDTYRPGRAVAPEVLFALTDQALSKPTWISVR